MTDTTLIAPTVHLNGTSRADLFDPLMRAHEALRTAIDAVAASAPNGRDYYPQGPEAFQAAAKQHASRMVRLNAVLQEIEFMAVTVNGD